MKDLFSQLPGVLPEDGLLRGSPRSRSRRLPEVACLQWLFNAGVEAPDPPAPAPRGWQLWGYLGRSAEALPCSSASPRLVPVSFPSASQVLIPRALPKLSPPPSPSQSLLPWEPKLQQWRGMIKNVWKPVIHMLSTLYMFDRLLFPHVINFYKYSMRARKSCSFRLINMGFFPPPRPQMQHFPLHCRAWLGDDGGNSISH